MIMFDEKGGNMTKIYQYLVLNVVMKLMKQKDYQCLPGHTNLEDSNMEVLTMMVMIQVPIMPGKVVPHHQVIVKIMMMMTMMKVKHPLKKMMINEIFITMCF